MNEFSETDKICVNCANYRPNYGPFMIYWIDSKLTNGKLFHRCALESEGGPYINKITGKFMNPKLFYFACEFIMDTGRCRWGPSKKFAAKKGNLFKMVSLDKN